MPLTLVLGPANSAKAGEVLGAYALAARRDGLLVVPTALDVEHYQRELAAPGVTLGRVLTFPALLDELARRVGHRRARLTPLQRERLLRAAVASLSLRTLEASARGAGFIRAAGRLIAELQQRRVPPARFASALRAWSKGSAQRRVYGTEVAALYRRYVELVARAERVDDETFRWGALDALRNAPAAWGGTPVFLYGFDDLTPIELDAVETLARHAGAAVTVSLTYEPGRAALAARASVVEELRGLAGEVRQLPALDDHYAPDAREPLHHLERHLFEPGAPVLDPGDAVTLLEAGGELAEAELVAAAVLAALGEGVPAAEIVVVCRSLTGSGARLEAALARYGVPVTSARRVPLEHTALGRALLALLRYALLPEPERSLADLIAYLRHPGVIGSADVVDRFEADVRRAGRTKLDLSQPGAVLLAPALAAVERLRERRDPAAALREHVRALLAAPHLARAATLSEAEQVDARAATVALQALTQLVELGERRPIAAPDLIELLQGLQVPVHGPVDDRSVLVSDPLAIRARRFRRVFVTGLCEGEFPALEGVGGDPFLGDERRRELALASGLALPPQADRIDRERYLLYACVSRATERLTLSYRSCDEDGNLVTASPFLDDIGDLLVPEWRARRARRLLADVVWDVEAAPTRRERRLALAAAGAGAGAGAGAPAGATPATRVLSEQALAHVRHTHVVSAGALETFAACPVRWLVERQLHHQDLEGDPDPLARGALIHKLLEHVVSRLHAPISLRTLRTAESVLHDAVERGADAIAPGQPPEVRAAILRGIEAELRRYLRHEASGGSAWRPAHVELRFGLDAGKEDSVPALELSDGEETILLNGVIDRVDVDPAAARRAIVRDYKSGARRDGWPGARWLADDQLQVALYMIAVRRLLGLEAVAGFYQPLAGGDLRPRGIYADGAEVGESVVTRDALGAEELGELLAEVERRAVAIGATLRRGELTPCPATCSPGGACRYPGICWAERAA